MDTLWIPYENPSSQPARVHFDLNSYKRLNFRKLQPQLGRKRHKRTQNSNKNLKTGILTRKTTKPDQKKISLFLCFNIASDEGQTTKIGVRCTG